MRTSRSLSIPRYVQSLVRSAISLLFLFGLFSSAPAHAAAPQANVSTPVGGASWSPARSAVSPTGDKFLGRFGSEAVTLTIADLPAHAKVTLAFDFYAMATWDGNAGGDIGPDVFNVTHSGNQTLLNTTFSNYPDQPQAYPGAYPGASHPGQTGASVVGAWGTPLDTIYKLNFTFAHTADVLQVKFAGIGLQPDGDETWGLDNVVVQVDGQVVYQFDGILPATEPVVEVAQLLATDRQADDNLGTAIAVHDDWLAAGAPVWVADNLLDQNQRAGAVYLFTRDPAGVYKWDQAQKLTPADGRPNDRFGWTVALDANWVVAGAPWVDVGANPDQGAVYLFARSQSDPNRWDQVQKLTAPDGAANEQFGQALALNGSLLLVGAKEKVYLFGLGTNDQWTLIKKLVASDGKPDDRFGQSVALAHDVALVGANGAAIGANYLQGAAYLFQQDQGGANQWGEFKKLTAPDGGILTFFGYPVILTDDQAIIGGSGKHQVYVFGRNTGGADTWGEGQRLTSMDGQTDYSFGMRLAYNNQHLVINGSAQAEIFERTNASALWTPLRKIKGSAGSNIDFQSSLAIHDNLVFVGGPSTSANDMSAFGAVYLFDLTRPSAPIFHFAQAVYTVTENVGVAQLPVVLDRPSPYPFTIDYATASMRNGAMPDEDYTPVSGSLKLPTGATQGIISVPIINDNLLELTEQLRLTLGNALGGIASEPHEALLTILDDDTVANCNYVANDEASLDRAIRCLYVAQPGNYTIQVTNNILLTRPLPLIMSPKVAEFQIAGNGHTIDAQGHGRVFAMYKIKATMHDLTLRGGRVPQVEDWTNPNLGGGIYADTPNIGFGVEASCALTLTNVVLTDNEAYAGGGLYYGCELPLRISNSTVSDNRAVVGGAFSTSGGEEFGTNVYVKGSTFSGNQALDSGGAFDLSIGDGGIILQLVNSTVSGNKATNKGGGLYITQSSIDGRSETQLINSTVANNQASTGSGVYNHYGILTMSNSIIAANNGSSNCAFFTSEDGNGQLVSQGYNLDSDGACLPAGVRQPSDIPNGKANLGPLADNGGPTWTQALLDGSQALDAAANAICVAAPVNGVDQRGIHRPQGARCDIGAFEAEAQAVISSVLAWGQNDGGQLNVPAGLQGVVALAGGYGHSIALKRDGTVVAWGRNQEGQTNVPAGLTGVTAIASGYHHNLAVKQDGTVVAWGWNGYGQTDVPPDLTDVIAVAGGYHSLALKRDGQLVAWGLNNEGQTTIPANLYGVTAIASGVEHNLALKRDGTVVAWGYNGNGEATVPANLQDVVAIAAGWFHSLALKRDGTVVAWGANDFGQATVPAGLHDVVAIAGGGYHSLALKRDGTVVAWGSNEFGQTTVPTNLQQATLIGAGGFHSLALAVAPITNHQLFVSSHSSGKAGNVKFRDEDIVAYDQTTNTWQMVFDGSDVGVTKDVDAFAFLPNGHLLLSFNAPTNVPGLGKVDDSDIVEFIPTELGEHTAGTFAWYLRGADVGLTTDGEDIDAIGFTPDGHLVVSTIGDFNTPTASGRDEDLFQLNNATLGNPTSGTWSLYFTGAKAGLANEDVNGVWIDPTNGELYLTVKDSFVFGTQRVDGNDIFVCTPSQDGGCTYRLFWDGDAQAYGSKHLDGIALGALPPTFKPAGAVQTADVLTAEEAVPDEDSDDLDMDEPLGQLFLPLVER